MAHSNKCEIDDNMITLMEDFNSYRDNAIILYNIDKEIDENNRKKLELETRRAAIVADTPEEAVTLYDRFRIINKLQG